MMLFLLRSAFIVLPTFAAASLHAKEPDESLPPHAVNRMGSSRFCLPQGIAACQRTTDGRFFLVQSYGTTVLLHASTGATLRQIPNDEMFRGPFSAITPDCRRIVAANWKGVEIWNLESMEREQTLVRSDQRSGAVSISANGKFVAIGCVDHNGKATVFDLSSGKLLLDFKPAATRDIKVALDPEGKFLATWGTHINFRDREGAREMSRLVQIWETATGNVKHAIVTDVGSPKAVLFSPDGSKILTAGDSVIQICDATTGKVVQRANMAVGTEFRIAWSRDSKRFAAAGSSGQFGIWNVATGKQTAQGEMPFTTIDGIACDRDGEFRSWGRHGNVVLACEIPSGKLLTPFKGHTGGILDLQFSGDGQTLYSVGFNDPRVLKWNPRTGAGPERLALEQDRKIADTLAFPVYGRGPIVALASGSELLATTHHYESFFLVHRISDGSKLFQRDVDRAYPSERTIFFSPDARRISLLPQHGNSISIWNARTGAVERTFSPRNGRGNWHSGAFSTDGKLLAGAYNTDHGTTGRSCAIHVFDIDANNAISKIVIDDTRADSIVFLDERRLLVLGIEKTILMHFDAVTGKPLREFEESPNGFLSGKLTLSRDGRLIAASSESVAKVVDGKQVSEPSRVLVWETASGRLRHTFQGHSGAVSAFAFSPDSTQLVSGGLDTTILLWNLRESSERTTRSAEELWQDLDRLDARVAELALRQLAARPIDTQALLVNNLHPVTISKTDEAAIEQIIADLDSKRFAVREAASKQLERMGPPVLKAIAKAQKMRPTTDLADRLEKLHSKIASADPEELKWRDFLRPLRAIELLERIDSAETRELLKKMAEGSTDAKPTRAAAAALRRMK